jgi:uncharacterized protein
METTFELILVLALSGAIAGYMAGLLGIGGGIVMVPVLFAAFAKVGAPPEYLMQITVGTSLAIMVPTAFFSARAHRHAGAVSRELVRGWGPWIFAGAILGAVIGINIKSDALVMIFAVLASLMGLKLLLPLDDAVLAKDVPKGAAGNAIAGAIGTVSGLMGIGGATFSVPTLTLFNQPIHRAVGTSSMFGLIVAVPGVLGYFIGGMAAGMMNETTLGFVNWPAVLVVAPLASFFAPKGARLAHTMHRRTLSVVFGIFLIAAAARMAYPVLTA